MEFSDFTRPFHQIKYRSPDDADQLSMFEDVSRIKEVVLLVLEYGANAADVDNDGNTALDLTIHYGL